MAVRKKTHDFNKGGGLQLGFFTPESDWKPRSVSDLPSWADAKRICIDCETRDTDLRELGPGPRRGGYTTGWAVKIEGGPKFYLPIRHEGGGNLPEQEVLQYLRDNARNFTGDIVGANLSYDLDYAANDGIVFHEDAMFRDIQIADPLIYELHFSYSLKNIGERWGVKGKETQLLEEAAKSFGLDPGSGMWRLHSKFVGEYAENDVEAPLLIYEKQRKKLDQDNLWQIYDIESKVIPVLVKMRRRGVRLDFDKLAQIEEWSLSEELSALGEIKRATQIEVKPGDIMKASALVPVFQELGIRLDKTPTGAPKIDAEMLEKLEHPVGKLIRHARKVNKIRTTFAASMRKYQVDGRIHCSFHQIVASQGDDKDQKGVRYGRLSATDPNLQQQPSPDRDPVIAGEWRKIFIPEEGAIWGCSDFCFSKDTEILTENGFILLSELKDELVAQYDTETKEIDYQKPLAKQRIRYKGEMVNMKGKWAVDLSMTPNHRCLLVDYYGRHKFVQAENLEDHRNSKNILAGFIKGSEKIISEKEIVSSVACQADGCWRKYHYRISVLKQRKIDRLEEFVSYSNKYLKSHDGEQISFTIPVEEATLLLPGKDKIFDYSKIIELSLEQRLFFLEELLKWDGSGTLGKGAGYGTTQKQNAEIVQRIAILSGLRANIKEHNRENRKTYWTVNFGGASEIGIFKFNIDRSSYDDLVYCVSMPKSTVVVRRNGKVCITGQSSQEPRWTTHFSAALKLPKAEEAAKRYRDDPRTDHHEMMTRLIYGDNLVNKWKAEDPKMFKVYRGYCKNIFLGLCYGEGGAKLSHTLGKPTRFAVQSGYGRDKKIEHFNNRQDAWKYKAENGGEIREVAGKEVQEILDNFDKEVPFVRGVARAAQKKAEDTGFVRTILGRRLHFSTNDQGKYDWTHKALNRVIQGSSADQTKKALVDLDRAGLFIQLQVHDEIDGSYGSVEEAEKVGKIMRESILELVQPQVPFLVDTETGPSWGEIK